MANDIAQKITALTELAKGIPESLLAAVDDPNSPGKKTKKLGFGTFLKTYNRSAAEISENLSNDDLDFKEDEGHFTRYGENTTPGVTVMTTPAQIAIDVAAQQVKGKAVAKGNFLIDTIEMKSNVTLDLTEATLNFVAHTTTKNVMIRMGSVATRITHAKIIGGKLNGNSANQTFPSEEFSHGVYIIGSDYCEVIGTEITDCKGDGVAIGHETGRIEPSDSNLLFDLELHLNTRQQITIFNGNENRILFNKVSGNIDLEIDAGANRDCKNNLVHGNTGRKQTQSTAVPRISDLVISTSTLNTDPKLTSGNIITDNHCFQIQGQYNDSLIVKGNLIVGSNSTQVRLLDFSAVNNLLINSNILIANTAVATSLTRLLRTRAGQHVTVTDNTGDDGGKPFHEYLSTFAAEPAADGHVFKNNNFDGGGDYRANSSHPFLTEESVYKLESNGANPQVFTFTNVSGPFLPLTASSSALDLVLNIGWAEAPAFYQVEVFPYGEVGAEAEPYDETVIASVDISGGNRFIRVFTAPLGTTLTYAQYSFAAGGTKGTIFLRLRY